MQHLGTKLLETERLILRKMTMQDAQSMYTNWANNDEVTRFVTWYPYDNVEDVRKRLIRLEEMYVENNFYSWGIELKESQQLIGEISFVDFSEKHETATLGYIIGKEFWGQGYMAEAVNRLINFAFKDLNLYRIQAFYDVRNPNSGRVMEKAGMKYEGTLRDCRIVKGERVTLKQYAILVTDK